MIRPSTPAEYKDALRAILIAAKMIRSWDLADLERGMTHNLEVGHLIDPTLWLTKHKALEQDRELVRAALYLWRYAERFERADELAATDKEPGS